MKKYLPVGSIVKLKNEDQLIMIIGYSFIVKLKQFFGYDYFGCYYPEGVIELEKNILFRHEDIENIFYMGYNSKKIKKINALNNILMRGNNDE